MNEQNRDKLPAGWMEYDLIEWQGELRAVEHEHSTILCENSSLFVLRCHQVPFRTWDLEDVKLYLRHAKIPYDAEMIADAINWLQSEGKEITAKAVVQLVAELIKVRKDEG